MTTPPTLSPGAPPTDRRPIELLLVEDNAADARLVQEMLRDIQPEGFVLAHVERLQDAVARLAGHRFDAILLDLALPDSEGLATFERARAQAPHSPIVVLTGAGDEAQALAAMRLGAQDYLVKGRVDGRLLLTSIRYAIERKRVEDALRESEERYRVVTETVTDAIFTLDEAGGVLFANPAAEQIFGYPPGELVGQPISVLMSDEAAHQHAAGLHTYLATGKRHADWRHVEYVARRKNGEAVPVEISYGEAVHGGKRLFTGVVRDTSDRKRAEAALRESEARYHELFENAPVGLYRSRPDGSLLQVNPSFARLLGYPDRDSALGANVQQLYVDPAERDRWMTLIEKRDAVVGFEVCLRRADATTAWFEDNAHVIRDPTGGVQSYQGALIDITGRKRAEEALRQSEERFRLLAEQAEDVIYRFRLVPPLGFEYVSPSVTRVVGYTPEEFCAEPALGARVIHPDDRKLLDPLAQEPGGTPGPTVLRAYHRDGRLIWTEHKVAIVRDPSGRPVALQGIARDISDRRTLEQQYLHAQKMEAVGRLAGGIAHDFNNLLTAITGYTDLVREDLAPGDSRRADLDEVRRAADRAAALTRQLLTFSRQQVVQPRLLDLNEVVSGVDKMLRRIIGEDVELETHLAADLPPVLADPGQLEQVILNLAVNARDAMPQGGRLTVETGTTDLDESYAAQWEGLTPGRHVLLAMSDTGCGMDAETQARIFEPFFTTKGPGKGTGLGLATVYGIVRQGGGHIAVHSEPGRGSTFTVYLPARSGMAEGFTATPGNEPVAGGTETILLVEDEDGVRKLSREVLGRYGYRILDARDGAEALALCRSRPEPVDLLVTDVVMPVIGGPETARELTALRPGLKVLYVSGYTDRAAAQQLAAERDTPYLQKPFTPAALARKVREVLDR